MTNEPQIPYTISFKASKPNPEWPAGGKPRVPHDIWSLPSGLRLLVLGQDWQDLQGYNALIKMTPVSFVSNAISRVKRRLRSNKFKKRYGKYLIHYKERSIKDLTLFQPGPRTTSLMWQIWWFRKKPPTPSLPPRIKCGINCSGSS